MDEFYKSKKWNRFVLKVGDNKLPLVILLFYDDMTKYKFAPSSMSGLYIIVLNLHHDLLSYLNNIYCLRLIHNDNKLNDILAELIDEFKTLYNVHQAKTQHETVKIRTFLGMFLVDTS